MKKIKGVVLIELLIAALLGAMIIIFLMQMYLASARSEQLQQALQQIQMNGKNAAAMLLTAVQRTGQIGCMQLGADYPKLVYQTDTLTAQNKLMGNDEMFTVRGMEYLSTATASAKNNVVLLAAKNQAIKSEQLLVIADCQHAELLKIANVSDQRLQTVNPLKNNYENDAEIGRFVIEKYFIAKTNRFYSNGEAVYALYREDNNEGKMELVEGIQQMKINYVLKKGGTLSEVAAAQVGDWSQVVAATFELTVVAPPFKKIWYVYGAIGSL